ncbi:hypothetical protein CANMA_004026 [Candida margitis]|uniref:uncharacterized protein n=1 Tax=Candida margitis TaxID=1775924 RepID=UPI0022260A8B|nr:uncharacterized protein CANMA_004026 [Candida margitis]KAI5960246.1 hypothetical protein CANMA_004026 [Candida margitis]
MDIIFIRQDNEDTCLSTNSYNGKYWPARVSSVPVLFVVSALGSFTPLLAAYSTRFRVPRWIFDAIKYFGSGVIIATGFIHLMAEAAANLGNKCLGPPFTNYPFAEGIALIGVFFIFFFDVVAHQRLSVKAKAYLEAEKNGDTSLEFESVGRSQSETLPEEDQESNSSKHTNGSTEIREVDKRDLSKLESIYQKILNCVVLECGIVLHSIFVGLSLTIAGDDFVTLYIAIAFHQFFEGLGLGTRFATTQWPKGKRYVPWVMSLAYSLTTPFASGIGLIVRGSYPAGSRTALITTGVFDAACAGILIYNSIAELMAFDFMYSGDFKNKPAKELLIAFFYLTLGAFVMALIGKWA